MSGVLILGGSGHLGAALRTRLPGRIAFSHHRMPSEGSIAFDFGGSGPLPAADVVIGSFPLARQLEGASRSAVVDAVCRYVDRCAGARLVQLSTDAVFSGEHGERSEGDMPDPRTPYGRAQAEVDAALQERAPEALIVRTSFIFGWAGGRLDKRLAPLAADPSRVIEQAWPADVFRSPTEVNFLAQGIARAIACGSTGILNIAGPRMSIAAFFARALEPFGPIQLPQPRLEANPDVARDTSLSSSRMAEVLGLDPMEVWTWYQRFFPEPPNDWRTVASTSAP
jgi:dTDP-4-dehydrorhamnose reductase